MYLVQVIEAGIKYVVHALNTDMTLKIGFAVKSDKTKLTCQCAAHRVKGSCEHVAIVKRGLWSGVNDGKKNTIFDLSEKKEDIGVLENLEADSLFLLTPPKEDVHLWQILQAMKEGKNYSSMGEGDIRTHSRISRELTNAFMRDLPLVNDDVTKAIETDDFVERVVKNEGAPVVEKDVTEIKPAKPTGMVWKDLKTPEEFFVTKENWEKLLWCGNRGKHAILTGPTGSGKSELVYLVAEALGVECEPFNFGAMTEARTSLIGSTHFNAEKGTFFNQSRFVQSVQKPSGVMLWDEITRAPSDAFNLILPLMDRQEYMSLDESEDGSVIYKGKAVSFMATANVGVEYTGTMALDRALLDRFKVKIDLDYPPQAEEERIIRLRFPTVPTGEIKKLVKIAASQRSLAVEGEYNTMISTRMLLDCCEMLNDSVSRKAAIEASIFGCFEKEGGEDSERVKVIQIFQKESYM